MLQIITGKFNKSTECYETLHRAVFYTNYQMIGDRRLETPIGVLLSTSGVESLSTMTCEITERIEKHPDGPAPGVIISTGGIALLNDFAAVTAFVLDIACTLDPDLTRRLLALERPSLGVAGVPCEYMKHTFARRVLAKDSDGPDLSRFLEMLTGLKRKNFEAAMRAIRQYINGLHRISDDLTLAYTQLVMSIESLSQCDSEPRPTWNDYDVRKRERIDKALQGASSCLADDVRNAILENEHAALAQRFRSFALSHIDPSYFRSEAPLRVIPASRNDLEVALKEAYAIRSRYVHTLQELPSQLTTKYETELVEGPGGRPLLTISGLARAARHIIQQFVLRNEKVEREDFYYWRSLPNLMTVTLASECWIADTRGFTYKLGPQRLTAFLEQFTSTILLRQPESRITDIRPILEIVESIVPGLGKPEQRLPLLTLYMLFQNVAGEEFRLSGWPSLIEKHLADFDLVSIESFLAHLLNNQVPSWSLEQWDKLHADYFRSRYWSGRTRIGRILEAALSLVIAELNRASGDMDRARQLIAYAVEAHPGHLGLRQFEAQLPSALSAIDWKEILLPSFDARRLQDEEDGLS